MVFKYWSYLVCLIYKGLIFKDQASHDNIKIFITFSFNPWFIFMEKKSFSGVYHYFQIATSNRYYFFCKFKSFIKQIWWYWWVKLSMSKTVNVHCCLFFIALNHSITDALFFHWLTFAFSIMHFLMLSSIRLLTFPNSDLHRLISLKLGLCGKSSLWSLTL